MKLSWKIIFHDVRVRIFLILFLLWIIGIWRAPSLQTIVFPLISILLFPLLDLAITFAKTKRWYYPFSSLISGLLIGLIIDPSSGLLPIVLAVLLGFLSKHFLKWKGRHVFNPAAFGIIITSVLLGTPIAWWAVAPGGISLLLCVGIAFILYKLKRIQIPIIFLTGYFLFFLFSRGLSTATALTFDGTVFLFSFVMLPEPMTSVISGFWKYGFALAVLGVLIISILINFTLVDSLLFALLMTNFITRITSK